jgi:hypothetical protein
MAILYARKMRAASGLILNRRCNGEAFLRFAAALDFKTFGVSCV